MTWLLGNRAPSERHPGRQPLAARTVAVAAVAALALAGCGGAADTSHASATATNASPANSTRPSECVFSSQYGPGVTDCTSADPTVATDLYSDGNCSTTTNRITISWGDRSQDQTVTITGPSTANSPKLEADHTYSRHGSYPITVSGTITSGPCSYNPPTVTYTFTYTPAVVASQVDCTRQNPSACLLASNAVAGLDAGDDDSDAPTGMEMKAHDVDNDGFAGAEFTDGQGNIIIANEDADLASPFGTATPYQNSSFLAEVQIYNGITPAALRTAVQFAQQVAATDHNARIYVTGFGLGGAEAQAQAQALGSRVTGGVTFGAPGLPGHKVAGSESTLTNFVDYGDPVGNWASDPQSELADLASEGTDHFGGVDLVGNPLAAALPRLAANTHKLELSAVLEKVFPGLPDNPTVKRLLTLGFSAETAEKAEKVSGIYDTSLQLATFAYLSGAALLYHSIGQYAQDLGVSLTPTVAAPDAIADWYREYDPAASQSVLQDAASTTVSTDGAVNAPTYKLTANTSTDELDTQKFGTPDDPQYDVSYDPAEQISSMAVNDPSGTSYVISNDDAGQQAWSSRVYYYSGPDETGTLTGTLYNWHSGGSQLQLFAGLPKGVSKQTLDYSQPDGTGTLLSKSSS
jgi:hypothetical protein